MSGPADVFAVQMAALTRLVVHLDERGVFDAQGYLAELLSIAPQMPPGQREAQKALCASLGAQLAASRQRRGAPTGGTH